MGGKSDAPAAPDYAGQARAQAEGNLTAARATTSANRMNQVTPYGQIKYTQSGGDFDQAGYENALAEHRAIMANPQMQQYFAAGGSSPAAPTRDQFMSNPDQWSSEIELSDTGRQLLDADSRSRLGLASLQDEAMARVRDSMGRPIDDGMAAWDKATGLIRERMNPELDRQQAALDTKLANMGMTAGSEGWGTQQTQFAKQRNDADIGAQLAGAQLQQQVFGQNAYLRNLPMNELQALRTGSAVTNPTFSTPGQQGQTSGPDLMGASQAGYNAQVGGVNAQNAATAQTNSALGSTAMLAAAYFF